MRNKKFSVQRDFINSLIILATICLLSLAVAYVEVTYAEETASINAECSTVNEQITIDIPCAEFSAKQFRLILDIYPNPADTEGLYFMLRDLPEISESVSSCAFMDDNLNLNINCVAFDGSQYTLFLENYTNPLDNEWFYWKLTDSIGQPIVSKESSNTSNLRSSRASLPNLTLYIPSGWSDKIVVSNTTGTTTDSTTIYDTDYIYVNYAIKNNGTSSASMLIYTKLYVDGKEKNSNTQFSMYANKSFEKKDISIGKLAVGNHTITVKTDTWDLNSESNENDNEYTKTITVKTKPITKPTPPASMSATALSSSSIKITWSDSSNNETGFYLYRWNGSSWANIKTLGAGTTLYTDTGLTANTTYYYAVASYNSAGTSPFNGNSNGYISAKTELPPAKPSPPASMSATALSSSSIKITWSDSSNNETGFYLYRWNGSSWSNIKTLGAGITSYTDTGLTANTTYYYAVASYNSAGISLFNGNSNRYVSAKTNAQNNDDQSLLSNLLKKTWYSSAPLAYITTTWGYKNDFEIKITFYDDYTYKATESYFFNNYGLSHGTSSNSYSGNFTLNGNKVTGDEFVFTINSTPELDGVFHGKVDYNF